MSLIVTLCLYSIVQSDLPTFSDGPKETSAALQDRASPRPSAQFPTWSFWTLTPCSASLSLGESHPFQRGLQTVFYFPLTAWACVEFDV